MDNLISALVDAHIVSQSLAEMYQSNKSAIKGIDRQLDCLYVGNLQKTENKIRHLEERKYRLNNAF